MTQRRHLSDTDLEILSIWLEERILSRLAQTERVLHQLVKQQGEMLMDLDRLTADVAADTDAVNAASALLAQLAQELRDAAGDPAAITALADQLEANNAALSAAVAANTPAAP